MTKTMTFASIGFGATALALGVLALTTMTAEAYRGEPGVPGSDCSAERHQAMEQAFTEKDYSAWKELMNGKGRVTQVVNEDNFSQFARAHELAEAGNLEEAREIRQSLGLGGGLQKGDRSGTGNMYRQSNQHGQQRGS